MTGRLAFAKPSKGRYIISTRSEEQIVGAARRNAGIAHTAAVVAGIAGVVLVYAMLFAVGRLIFGAYGQAALFLAAGLAAAAVIYRDLSRRGFAKVVE